MSIQFAEDEERRHTGNIKWDLQGPLPFGIADMDIQSPPCLIEALERRLRHPFFGYAFMTNELRGAIVDYLRERHGVQARPEWLHDLPGCVPAFTLVARAICTPTHAGVMVCTPAYPPMLHCHEDTDCKLITVPCRSEGGHWSFDWEAMERAVQPDTKLFLLCNPQNPLGRCWTREELLRVGEFCCRHDLILCSDEIHCDLVLDEGLRHHCALNLPEEVLQRTVMLSAPSKTFNMAGICFTFMAVPNAELRERIIKAQGHSLPTLNVFAYATAEAVYREGWAWHAELIEALRRNRDTARNFIRERLPELKLGTHEATYLMWIDCSALGVDSPHLFFLREAGVFLDDGANFGSPQCVRLNFATSPQLLLRGLEAMASAVDRMKKSRKG